MLTLGQMLRELVQEGASPNGVGEQPAGQELAPPEDETPKDADNHADALGQMLRELVQDGASPNGVSEQPAGQELAPPKMKHQRARTTTLMLSVKCCVSSFRMGLPRMASANNRRAKN